MSTSAQWQRWPWMTTAVFAIGALSVALFIWIEWIDGQLREYSGTLNAIKDIQIQTATSHLRIDDAVAGLTEADVGRITADLDQTVRLVKATIDGGEAEGGRVAPSLDDPGLRARAEGVKSALMKFKAIGLARLQNPGKSGAGSSIGAEFHDTFREILAKSRDVEHIIEADKTSRIKASRRFFFTILATWALIGAVATGALWRSERHRKSAEGELVRMNEQLLSQKDELTEHRERLERLVQERTIELTRANAILKDEIAERKQAEAVLKETEGRIRHLSSQLLKAQEVERKRVSGALHDELGQALNVMKLETRGIQSRLREDQGVMRDACEKLLDYMDHVIEDVRRISLDLSPTVLEDLGLTAALQWLISGVSKDPAIEITSDIAEIDDDLAEDHKIVIYRVIQETLTNIVKHAQAAKASLTILRRNGQIMFSVEDDGKGFDPKEVGTKDGFAAGLGLTTMKERVDMIGGVFDLWSQKGEGTRITFSIPATKGES